MINLDRLLDPAGADNSKSLGSNARRRNCSQPMPPEATGDAKAAVDSASGDHDGRYDFVDTKERGSKNVDSIPNSSTDTSPVDSKQPNDKDDPARQGNLNFLNLSNQPKAMFEKRLPESIQVKRLSAYQRRTRPKVVVEAYDILASSQEELNDATEEVREAKKRYEAAVERRAKAEVSVASATRAVTNAELSQPDEPWNLMYRKLHAYKVENGHCHLPTRCGSDPEMDNLCKWVEAQRRNRRRSKKQYRMEALDALGFVWEPKVDVFRKRVEELKSYMNEHGNANIPFKYPPNQPLAFWVAFQRKEYKKLKEGRPADLTQERIELLESVGFTWTHDSSRKRKSRADSMTEEQLWEEGFQLLVQFRERNGHCRVYCRNGDNTCRQKNLEKWVSWQRKQRILFLEGKESQMTQERIDRIEEVGLEWGNRCYNRKRI